MSVNLLVPGQDQQQQLRHSISIPASTTANSNTGNVLSLPDNQPQPRGLMRAKSVGPESPNKTSRRVNLGPGCGLLDWIRLTRSKKDIAGNGGTMLLVSEEELAEHCTEKDAWTCVRGKVYNITPYFKFHPGGKEDLLRAAGIDSTILFDEFHSWVNIESMLAKCLVGTMAARPRSNSINRTRSGSMKKQRRETLTLPMSRKDSLSSPSTHTTPRGEGGLTISMRALNVTSTKVVVPLPAIAIQRDVKPGDDPGDTAEHTPQSPIKPPIHVVEDDVDSPAAVNIVPPSPVRKNSDASRPRPRWEWYETNSDLVIVVYSNHSKSMKVSDIVLDVNDLEFEAAMEMDGWVYQLKIALCHQITQSSVAIHHAKVEIRLIKKDPSIHWGSVGTMLPGNDEMTAKINRDAKYRSCVVDSIATVTHDTKLFTLRMPSGSHLIVPTGHHVQIKAGSGSTEVERSYTPVVALPRSTNNHSLSSKHDTLELMIKLYGDGEMSQHLTKLNVGDSLLVSDSQGIFDASRLSTVTEAVLIAAGSGLTPMIAVARDLLTQPNPPLGRTVQLLFANKQDKDIMWRDEFDQLARDFSGFSIVNILSQPNNSWNGLTGRINQKLLRDHIPPPPATKEERNQQLICMCGPQPFTLGLSDIFMDLDYPEECLHLFT